MRSKPSSALRFLHCLPMQMTNAIENSCSNTWYTITCRRVETTRVDVARIFRNSVVERTHTDDRGYVRYRRRSAQDTYVVPHNRHLLLLCDSHINVEVSCTVNLIMYLYKYMFKGPDRARYEFGDVVDKIHNYIQARYVSCGLPPTPVTFNCGSQLFHTHTHTHTHIRCTRTHRYLSASEGSLATTSTIENQVRCAYLSTCQAVTMSSSRKATKR